jgi:hypothetical protein
MSDAEVLALFEKGERERAERAKGDDLEANIAAAADDDQPGGLSFDEQRRQAWLAANPGKPIVGTPWNVEGAL